MNKIASPAELASEIRKILAYTEGEQNPSREKLASDLRSLAAGLDGQPHVLGGSNEGELDNANFMRIERLVEDTLFHATAMKKALELYRRGGRYTPQLDNLKQAALRVSSDMRVLLRTLGVN